MKSEKLIEVHITYYEKEHDLYSKGLNMIGKSFSDIAWRFEQEYKGIIVNIVKK